MPHDVFICHSSKDKAWADAVRSTLEANGIPCWIAPRDIPAGVAYPEAAAKAISASRVLVLILSAQANDSRHVLQELDLSFKPETKIPMIPVRIDDAPLSSALQYFTSIPQWLDATSPEPEKNLAALVPAVQRLLASEVTPLERVVVPKIPKLLKAERSLHQLKLAVAVAVALLMIAAGGYWYRHRVDSVLVMPFHTEMGSVQQSGGKTMSASPEINNYLRVDFPWDIIGSLRKLPRTRYLAKPTRETLQSWADKDENPTEASKIAGVKKVLVGNFLFTGDRPTFRAQLEVPSKEEVQWTYPSTTEANTVQPCLKDPTDQKRLLPLRKAILEGVLANLSPAPSAEDRRRVLKTPTDNCEAYDLYLRARQAWNQRKAKGFRKAVELYRQAIERDPKFALAHAGLADCFNLMADYSVVPPGDLREGFPAALASAERALKIDPELAEAHVSKAFALFQFKREWDAAEREFQKASQLDPSYTTGLQWRAVYLSALRRHDEALELIHEAMEYDETSPILRTNLGWLLHLAHRDEDGEEQLHSVLQSYPNFEEAHRQLGDIRLSKKDYSGGLAEYQKAASQSSGGTGEIAVEYESLIARAKAFLGQLDEADLAVRKFEGQYAAFAAATTKPLTPGAREAVKYMPASYIALIYIALGDTDSAFRWLNKSIDDRSDEMILLNVDPAYEPLRNDPRFGNLLKRAGLS